jgi:putative redox protein
MNEEMKIRFPGGKRVYADYDGFEIRTDQNPDSGGEGTAPEPFDLFLASLGTCAGIYVYSFCAKRGISIEGLGLTMSWTRDADKKLGGVRIAIELPPGFPPKYHDAVVRAAERCTVKRVMESPPAIETVVEAAG